VPGSGRRPVSGSASHQCWTWLAPGIKLCLHESHIATDCDPDGGRSGAGSVILHSPFGRSEVYLTTEGFGAHGDGVADDTDAVLKAIDKAVESASQGIVFIPEGRYRVSKTVNVRASVRLIGTARNVRY
jgi:pectate lyase-like protein